MQCVKVMNKSSARVVSFVCRLWSGTVKDYQFRKVKNDPKSEVTMYKFET